VNGTDAEEFADHCLMRGCKFIFPSTTSVYGSQESVVDETCTELDAQSPYAVGKRCAEIGLEGLDGCVIFRFGTIVGPSPGIRFHTAVNKFCWQAVMGQDLTVWETALRQVRPYLLLEDAIRVILYAINNNVFGGEIYNVVSENLTVGQILDMIGESVPGIRFDLVDSPIMNQLSYRVRGMKWYSREWQNMGFIRDGIRETIEMLRSANDTA